MVVGGGLRCIAGCSERGDRWALFLDGLKSEDEGESTRCGGGESRATRVKCHDKPLRMQALLRLERRPLEAASARVEFQANEGKRLCRRLLQM